jgi:hypothetical protein
MALALLAMVIVPLSARAGEWIQVSCINPDGSGAPSQGWSGSAIGSPPIASQANPRCTPQVPMEAILWEGQPAPYGSEELLQYAPPAGSAIVGGTLTVGLYADGYGSGSSTYVWGSAGVLEPSSEITPANIVKQCTNAQNACQNGTNDYVGSLSLPADAGGDVYVYANCNGFNTNGSCDAGGSNSAWALAQVSSAHILLLDDAVPTGFGFAGTVFTPHVSGDATMTFTAADPGGPGVYAIVVALDGHPVYAGTPNPNNGACAPVGTDPSTHALMFDYQQPCPLSQLAGFAIPTAGLRDGKHSLTVTVTDAAGNSSEVLARTITTRNSGSTRTRLPGLHVRLTFLWHWNGRHTTLTRARVAHLPRSARATLRCSGKGCPKLPRVHRVAGLLHALLGARFRSGEELLLTITARGRRAERIRITIRNNRVPLARLVH